MRSAFLLVPLFGAALAAQGIVAPAHFTFAEGNHSSSDGPGATAFQTRFLQIHNSISNAQTIKSIALRRDGYATGDYPRYTILCDIYMSSGGRSAWSTAANFDSNHGKDKVQVVKSGLFSIAPTKPGALPNPFVYRFPLNTPFKFAGNKPLCWEMLISSRSNKTPMIFDACVSWTDNPDIETWHNGQGCKASGKTTGMELTVNSTPDWKNGKATLFFNGKNLPMQSFLSLGSNDKAWGPIKLPFQLTGTNCFIYTDTLLSLGMTVGGNGAATQSISTKVGLSLHGGSLFSQIIGLDKPANAWGVATSNLAQHHFIAPFTTVGIGHAFLHGSLGANGKAISFQGLVTRFD